jgi:hypothetical protein
MMLLQGCLTWLPETMNSKGILSLLEPLLLEIPGLCTFAWIVQ